MPEGLQKKIGPLPLWAWALIMGGVIGGVILLRKGADDGTADGSVVGSDTSGQIFPGATDGASGGSLTGTGGAPTLQDGLTSTLTTIQQLKDAGLWPDVATQGAPAAPPALIDLAPGHSYYDPTTGETVSGPEQIAAKSATAGTTTPGKKPSALDRAMTSVQKGAVGPINRKRLNKAGYTNAQIDFHIKSKTPLKQPDKVQHPKKTGPAKGNQKPVGKATAASTHPLQHVTAAAPNHAKAPAYRVVAGKDSHGNKGVFHVYSDHRVFVRS